MNVWVMQVCNVTRSFVIVKNSVYATHLKMYYKYTMKMLKNMNIQHKTIETYNSYSKIHVGIYKIFGIHYQF